jgi:hypothetical protein
VLPLLDECIRQLEKPEIHREITLVLDHLSRVGVILTGRQDWRKAGRKKRGG